MMLLALVLGATANALRPAAGRLAWVGDWSRHIETLAFRAGIPVVFLNGTRELVNNPETVVFDARPPEEYAAGHLPGALNLPVGEVDARIGRYAHLLTPETPILTYCDGMDCTDGLELARKIRAFGFNNVTLYPGGFAEWVAYEGKIRTGEDP